MTRPMSLSRHHSLRRVLGGGDSLYRLAPAVPLNPRPPGADRTPRGGTAVIFEGAVAVMLLERRHETLALGLAALWPIGLIPATGWPYWLTNLPLGLGPGVLWWRSRTKGGPAPEVMA